MFIDIHVIQPLPSSNVNRDETGSPKTALYGGVRRHRVSSQSWKRATRETFADFVSEEYLGTRTKRAIELVAKEIVQLDPEAAERAVVLAEGVFKPLDLGMEAVTETDGDGEEKAKELKTLFFLSKTQV
ncbi:hypothetical protein HMPREF1627_01040, partial [Actinomyces sp. S6-Spd3]